MKTRSMKFLKRAYIGLILLILYLPIAVLILFSFNDSISRGKWTGFTFDWYIELFQDPIILNALYNTLLIAVLSAFFATVIGTCAALGIDRMRPFSKKIIMNITNIPVINADIVTGVSLMLLYIFIFSFFKSAKFGFFTMLISHITFNIPYVILSVLPRLRRTDNNLYEAALDLGANPLVAFFKVQMPLIMPGIVSGALLSFTLSVDDFVISFFTTGQGFNNISILVYSMVRRGINPKINALSTLLFVAVLVLLYVINKHDLNKDKKFTGGVADGK